MTRPYIAWKDIHISEGRKYARPYIHQQGYFGNNMEELMAAVDNDDRRTLIHIDAGKLVDRCFRGAKYHDACYKDFSMFIPLTEVRPSPGIYHA